MSCVGCHERKGKLWHIIYVLNRIAFSNCPHTLQCSKELSSGWKSRRVSPLEWHYSCTILFLIRNPHNTFKTNRCIGILGLSQKKNSKPSFCHSERLCCEPWLVLSLHRSQPPPSSVVGLKLVCFYSLIRDLSWFISTLFHYS